MIKIAFIDTLGLCYDGSTLSKRGLGGSESAVIYLSRELAKLGLDVTVFNDCTSDDAFPGYYNGVLFRPLIDVQSTTENYDVMIASRSVAAFAPVEMRSQFKNFIGGLPDFTNIMSRSKHKVLWMHDTFCDGDDLIEYFINIGRIDGIFTLTDWHTSYITNCDHGYRRNFDVLKKNIFQTRNGIGIKPEYVEIRDKDPMHFVYNSSVTKGMVPLVNRVWPELKKRLPDAKLTIIGGYYKFRENSTPDQQELDWKNLVRDNPDINFTGIITQQEISDILRTASYLLYPTAFPETFGISTLEALAHNVTPITCRFGALEETAIDLMSYKINYPVEKNWSCQWLNEDEQVDHFVNLAMYAVNTPYLHQQKMYACNQVKDICMWDTIALQWKQHLYHKLEKFLSIDEYRAVTKINHRVHKVFGRRFNNLVENIEPRTMPYHKINVVTPVYNAESYIENCILSVAQQDYENYTMTIIDDCSTDSTYEVALNTIHGLSPNIRSRFILKRNDCNMGAVYNQIKNSENLDGIIMLLDGDDWLVNDPGIFHKYNNIYNEGAEFTYGSCWSIIDNIPLIAQAYPDNIKKEKAYRKYKFNWNMPYTHLRTFSSKLLYDYIGDNGYHSFKDENGDWLRAGGDTAIFYSLIEAAHPDKVICVPDIVYKYNDANPINDYKVNGEEQTKTANRVIESISVFEDGIYDLRPL
jgi:glycosyltransferase involved in cell wall biosynthesis